MCRAEREEVRSIKHPAAPAAILRNLTLAMRLFDDGVVVRVILKSAASVNDAREPEPVEFTHEMARGIHL